MGGEGGRGDRVGRGRASCWRDESCNLSDNHHRDRTADGLKKGDGLIVIDVDAGDTVDRDHLKSFTLSPASSAGLPAVTLDMKMPSSSPLKGVEPSPPAMLSHKRLSVRENEISFVP